MSVDCYVLFNETAPPEIYTYGHTLSIHYALPISLRLIKKTDKKATYDWDKGLATWSGDVKPERAGPVKLQPGDVDARLLNLELARDVQAGEPLDYRKIGRANV